MSAVLLSVGSRFLHQLDSDGHREPGTAYMRVTLIMMPSTAVIPAMPIEEIIDPACARTIRWSPKRSPPDCADNAADHSAWRSSDHKPRPGPECRADGIGLRRYWNSNNQENWCGCEYNLTHRSPPMVGVEVASVALQRPQSTLPRFPIHCGVTVTGPHRARMKTQAGERMDIRN